MPRLVYLLVAVPLFMASVEDSGAQASRYTSISGSVVSDSTGQPLDGAHVFIAVSMYGTTTDAQGRYVLENVPLGAHRLYVSMVGYEPEPRDVMLRPDGETVFNFRLKPSVVEIGEVTVEARQDRRWRQRLEKFTRLFIGETPNAEQTKIMNPEVLDFEERVDRFVARASETLIIENRALGYRIQYFLKEFGSTPRRTWYDGEPLFEELEPAGPDEAAIWQSARRKAFMGSFRHFMLALLADQADEQGFRTYSRPPFDLTGARSAPGAGAAGGFSMQHRFPIKRAEILKDGDSAEEKSVDFHGAVEIVYMGEMEDPAYRKWRDQHGRGAGLTTSSDRYQTSFIQLEQGPTVVDWKGDVLDPYGVTFMGYFAFERVADEVPKEYRPRE
jgi:hypothetical protein